MHCVRFAQCMQNTSRHCVDCVRFKQCMHHTSNIMCNCVQFTQYIKYILCHMCSSQSTCNTHEAHHAIYAVHTTHTAQLRRHMRCVHFRHHTSGALKGRDCISKLILEVSVPVTLKQLPKSISFTPTLPLSATAALLIPPLVSLAHVLLCSYAPLLKERLRLPLYPFHATALLLPFLYP